MSSIPADAKHHKRLPHAAWTPVLTYHHVKWDKPTDDAIELGLTIPPTQFIRELDYLRRSRYHTISAVDIARRLRFDRPLPVKRVVLTFDDGYRDTYWHVYKPLRKHHMRATFFIVPGFLGTPRYLTWRQVKEMSRHGMDIEAHTMTHPDLTILKTPKLKWEIGASRQELQRRLHRSIRVFCYPYGRYNGHVVAEVAHQDYWAAFTTRAGWWDRRGEIFTLPRLYVNRDVTLQTFAIRLTGSR